MLERITARQFSLRAYLVLLVVAAVVPLLAFAAGMFVWNIRLQDAAFKQGMRDVGRALSITVDREVGKVISVLETLAASPFLDSRDFKSFYQLCLRAANNRNESWVVLFDETGQQLINTREPFGALLPNSLRDPTKIPVVSKGTLLQSGSPATVKSVLETGQISVSDLFIGLRSNRPSLAITVPVRRDGKIKYAISMGIVPEEFTKLLREHALSNNFYAVIVDRKGTIIGRTHNPEKFVGQLARTGLVERLASSEEGWAHGLILEGVPVDYTYVRSKLTGWGIALGVAEGGMNKGTRSIAILAGGGALLLFLALALAIALGRRIASPISTLANSADAIQRGERPSIVDSKIREVTTLQAELLQNLTARQNLEEQLRQSQKMESIGTLAGGIAHDFNNILAVIMAHAADLKESKLEPVEINNSLEAILTSSQRGADIVRQLLTFARTAPESFGQVHVEDLLNGFLTMVQRTFPKSIELSLTVEAALPPIWGDAVQIEQALLNVCINARDAMPSGGKLTIAATAVTRENGDHFVCIGVTDTGVGMDEGVRSRAFDPFFTTKEKQGGTGLGLAIVYGIVNQHRGFVRIESMKGSGTEVRLCFPVSQGD